MEAELRGGGFLDDLDVVHPMLRSGILEDGTSTRHSDLGFRVCATVEVKKAVPAGVASLLDTMPALPNTVWELALNASEYYKEARYRDHRRRRYEEDDDV